MEESVKIMQIKQTVKDEELDFLSNSNSENICFFRFVGGNPSESERLVEQLYRLKEKSSLLIGIFRFPFRFEGKSRMETAIKQYFALRKYCDAITYFQSDGMMDMLNAEASIREANEMFEQYEQTPIQSIEHMIHKTGNMNIDVHDLKAFIHRGTGTLFIRTFEGDSFDEPLKYIISDPCLPSNYVDGKQIMINMGYSQDVDMNAFRQINLRLNDMFHKAEIYKLGSYMINEQGARLKITLIVDGIPDPYAQPQQMDHPSLYRFWLKSRWERLLQRGQHSKLISSIMKKDHDNQNKQTKTSI